MRFDKALRSKERIVLVFFGKKVVIDFIGGKYLNVQTPQILYKYYVITLGQLVIDEKTCLKRMVKKLSTNPQLEENQYYYSEDPIQCQYGFLPTQLCIWVLTRNRISIFSNFSKISLYFKKSNYFFRHPGSTRGFQRLGIL